MSRYSHDPSPRDILDGMIETARIVSRDALVGVAKRAGGAALWLATSVLPQGVDENNKHIEQENEKF